MTLKRQPFAEQVTGISESVTAVGSGSLAFLSGQVALGDDGALVEGDAELQARVVFERIEAALARLGAGRGDVVKLTVYVTDFGDLGAIDRARSEFFGHELPASTAVQVAALYGGAALEVEAVAFVEAGR